MDDGPQDQPRQRILVIADKTCPCPELHERIAARGGADLEVMVVAPALNSRLRHYMSDVDQAVMVAEARLALAIESLREKGVTATGRVGDSDPLVAIGDSLATFGADEVIVSTHPPGESNWLERDLPERARERYEVTVTHLVSEYGMEAAA